MRIFAASLLLSAIVATPAFAQDDPAKPFEGPSATVIVGVDHAGGFDNDGTGLTYGGQLGYDWQRGKTVFGVEGEIDGSTTKTCQTTFFTSSPAIAHYCEKPGRDLYVGGRIGRVIGDTTLLYVKGGYTNLRTSFDYDDGGTGSTNFSGSGTNDGFRVGAGVEKALGKNVLVKAEYRYSDYGTYSPHNQAVLGLGFRF